MKKKRFASLLLVAPLALLAACTNTPALTLESNWFADTSRKTIPDDFEETLEYAVSFEKSTSALNGEFSLDYPNGGTYKTKLEDGEIDGKKTYVYTTELKTGVQYTLNGVSSEIMEDVVTTRVEFYDVANELRPVSSMREATVTIPHTSPTNPLASLEAGYGKYHYRVELVYDWETEKAQYTFTNLTSEETAKTPYTKEIGVGGKGSYFDNEQLAVVLRASALSSSLTFRLIDITSQSHEKITVKEGPSAVTLKQSVKYKTDEQAVERDYNAFELGIALNKANPGGTQKMTFAQRGSRDSNTHRNVLLKWEYPVIYSHGALSYRLTAANFYG